MKYSPRIEEALRAIRVSLRCSMNGVVSADMRNRGLSYRLNFGVTLPQLKRIAAKYTPDCELGEALWAQDVRECKILATLLYPVEQFTEEQAEAWITADVPDEIRDYCCINLVAQTAYAIPLALKWLAEADRKHRYAGAQLCAGLFRLRAPFTGEQVEAFMQCAKKLYGDCDRPLFAVLINALRRAVSTDSEMFQLAGRVYADWHDHPNEQCRMVYNELFDN